MSDFRIEHPQASTALGLGIAGLLGGVILILPLVVSPVAWRLGRRAVREIDATEGVLSGRDKARIGALLGLVGTVLLGALLSVVAVFLAVTAIGLSSR